MYEQSARWNTYYGDPDPKWRRRKLDELCMTEPDDGANAYRLRLWEARHLDAKNPGGEVDRFLFQCVNLIQVYRTARMFKKSAAKQAVKAMADMLCSEAAQYGEAGERALYWELRNAAMRYFKTCEGSGYNRGLFGMIASGDGSRRDRICREVWEMSIGLARRTGLEDEMRVWNRAVVDAYSQFEGNAQALLEAYARSEGVKG